VGGDVLNGFEYVDLAIVLIDRPAAATGGAQYNTGAALLGGDSGDLLG